VALIVQKYGGSSVGSIEKIRNVARKVLAAKQNGNDMVVVLSAMKGETDRLLNLAHDICDDPDRREMDSMISTGEQVSTALFAIAVKDMGYDAVSLLGSQVAVHTNTAYGSAQIEGIDSERIKKELAEGRVVTVAGFQGVDPGGNITTLGRGGSDTTAVALAAALDADLCEIFTDVEGVYTTDPNVVEEARKIPRISHDEMMEMASLGAKVLEIRSVQFAKNFNVPLHVRSTFVDTEGTMVVEEEEGMEQQLVTGVAYNKNQARLTIFKVPDRPGIAARIFRLISDANIVVDMIIQNIRSGDLTDVSFTVSKTDFKRAMELVRNVAQEVKAERVMGDDSISKVSIVGAGMQNHPGVASRMFDALARENINIFMISTSEIKISCVIEEKYTELAVRVLHREFELDKAGAQ
jgi:aspartate kinase